MDLSQFGDIDLLSTILETMTDGVMVVDTKGTIVCLNPAAEKITGYHSSEVVGKPCNVLETDTCFDSVNDGEQRLCDVFKYGKVLGKHCRIKSKDGKSIMLLKNAVVLRNNEDTVIGAVETMTDITSLFMKEMELEELRQELSNEYGFMGMIGTSPAIRKIFEQIENAAQSDVPVIIQGESGTGKELVAQAIHGLSRRKSGPFIRVNCAALNEHLLESELFGHRKGAFTGAIKDRKGRFEAAQKGSLFLDEVGDMPQAMQAKLLRVLQEKEVERIGDNHPIQVDVRILTATNKDLHSLVADGSFREDLFYRVNVIPISVPPLRERAEDIPHLTSHFLKKISLVGSKRIESLTPVAADALEAYEWPGNVRQLINVLEFAAVTCTGTSIDLKHLPEYITQNPERIHHGQNSNGSEKQKVLSALRANDLNRTRTAKALGISRVALWKKMKRLGIEV